MGTTSPTASPERELDVDAIKDWVVERKQPLMIAGAALVVVVAVGVFWQQSTRLKNERADNAYGTAQAAYYQGNIPQAKSDLEKVPTRYPGTVGAAQATMLLAQIAYGEGKWDDGIKKLTEIVGSVPPQFKSQVLETIAAGHADAKRYDQAADFYLKAADAAAFEADKAVYRADAARMYQAGGKAAEARKLWASLAVDRDSPVLNEAKVRLGELDAKVAK